MPSPRRPAAWVSLSRARREWRQDEEYRGARFFLTGQPGAMKVTDRAVHKIDGKPLYDWKEKDGKWQKVPAS